MSTSGQSGVDTQALLAALFVGDRPKVPADLMGDLRDDSDAREMFNQLAFLDSVLGAERANAESSGFEEAAGELSFLSALDAQLAHESQAEPPHNVIAFPFKKQAFGAVALAAVALLAATFALQPTAPDEFQARTAVAPATSTFQKPSVHVFCVQNSADGPTFKSADHAEFGVLKCSTSDELKLAYTNIDDRLKYGAFVGVSETGELFWYGPSPATPTALSIDMTGDGPKPVGESVRLGVNHQAGALRVYGVFTTQPLTFDKLQRWASESPNLYQNARFDHDGVVVSATMEVTESQP